MQLSNQERSECASVYIGTVQSSLVNSNNRNTCSTSNYIVSSGSSQRVLVS